MSTGAKITTSSDKLTAIDGCLEDEQREAYTWSFTVRQVRRAAVFYVDG